MESACMHVQLSNEMTVKIRELSLIVLQTLTLLGEVYIISVNLFNASHLS